MGIGGCARAGQPPTRCSFIRLVVPARGHRAADSGGDHHRARAVPAAKERAADLLIAPKIRGSNRRGEELPEATETAQGAFSFSMMAQSTLWRTAVMLKTCTCGRAICADASFRDAPDAPCAPAPVCSQNQIQIAERRYVTVFVCGGSWSAGGASRRGAEGSPQRLTETVRTVSVEFAFARRGVQCTSSRSTPSGFDMALRAALLPVGTLRGSENG